MDSICKQECQQKTSNQKQGSQRIKILIVDERFRQKLQLFLKSEYSINQFEGLAAALDGDIVNMHQGIIGLRKILSVGHQWQKQPYISILQTHVIPKVFKFIEQVEYPQLKLQAAWALANIASGSYDLCRSIVEKGAIPVCIQLLKSKFYTEAVWGIGNIAAQTPEYRDQIIRRGGVQCLIHLIKNIPPTSNIQVFLWALSNLCRQTPQKKGFRKFYQVAQALRIMCKAIAQEKIKDQNTQIDCCWAISYLADTQSFRQILIQSGIVPTLMKKLRQQPSFVYLRVIGNISYSNQRQTSELLKEDRLQVIASMLHSGDKKMRKEACWIISNITAGTRQQADLIIQSQTIISQLLYLFNNDVFATRYNIGYVFSNMSHTADSFKVFQLYKRTEIVHYYFKSLFDCQPSKFSDVIQCLWTVLDHANKFLVDDKNALMLLLTEEEVQLLRKIEYHICFQNLIVGKYYLMMEQIKQCKMIAE